MPSKRTELAQPKPQLDMIPCSQQELNEVQFTVRAIQQQNELLAIAKDRLQAVLYRAAREHGVDLAAYEFDFQQGGFALKVKE
jgi:hypothetical protein